MRTKSEIDQIEGKEKRKLESRTDDIRSREKEKENLKEDLEH